MHSLGYTPDTIMNHCLQLALFLLLVMLNFGILNIAYYFPAKCNKLPTLYQHAQQRHVMTLEKQRIRDTPLASSQFKLPQFVIDRIKTFVFFFAYAHSGHSIVGSLMDSHPHIVISHEVDVFNKLSEGKLSPTKQDIFNAVWRNTMQTIINGHRAENFKGYNLLVDGLYQGKYIDHIDVIGDKKGGGTIHLLLQKPEEWSRVYDILKSLNVKLKVIQVYRNPYDTIATTLLLRHNKEIKFANVKQHNITRKGSSVQVIEDYFLYHNAIINVKKMYNLDLAEIHGKDLISDPRGNLLKLCNHVGVNCSNDYLDICSNKVFKNESKTRRLIEWTDQQLQMIQQNIDKYSDLKGYSFDSL